MKPIDEIEFKVHEATIIREQVSVASFTILTKPALAVLSDIFRLRYDMSRLPARLIRDAGMDELEIERSRLAKASLIR